MERLYPPMIYIMNKTGSQPSGTAFKSSWEVIFQKNKGIGVGGRQVMRNEGQWACGNKTMEYDRGKPKE